MGEWMMGAMKGRMYTQTRVADALRLTEKIKVRSRAALHCRLHEDGKRNEEQDPIIIEPIRQRWCPASAAASGGRTPWRCWLVCMCRATGVERTGGMDRRHRS